MDGGEVTLLTELRAAVGAEHVITHDHQLRTYESDGLLQYAALPRAAVLPADADQVRRVVRACSDAGVPVV
ncbi:MAG: glycolate oxidase, partial [Thermoleophilaceae bacterium]|nr:glycolate oxidase [Thermoleophilaceae bacterium]